MVTMSAVLLVRAVASAMLQLAQWAIFLARPKYKSLETFNVRTSIRIVHLLR